MEVHLRTALGQLDPSGQESMVMLHQHWQGMRDTIAEALLAAVALALDFQTWRTLVRGQGLGEKPWVDGGDGSLPDAHLVIAF